MVSSLLQADLQILAVARFVEETAAEFASEQYASLDIPPSTSSPSGDHDDRNLKIQLGAAGDSSLTDGWINIDIMGGRAVRTKDDAQPLEMSLNVATTALPFQDECCTAVFMAHMLEHLEFPDQTFFLLHEIHRVLRSGQTVRIVVPDSAKWMRAYQEDPTGEKTSFWKAARREWTDWNWDDEPLLPLILAYIGALDNTMESPNPHRAGFDWILMKDVLEKVGFVNVVKSRFNESQHESLRVDEISEAASTYWTNEKGEREFFSLFVEATKS